LVSVTTRSKWGGSGGIEPLAKHFLELAAKANDRPGIRLEDDAIQVLASCSFPGNVRELRNVTERLVILTPDDLIRAGDVRAVLPGGSAPKAHGLYRPGIPFRVLVEEAERQVIQDALTHHGGQMAATARALDLERSRKQSLPRRGARTYDGTAPMARTLPEAAFQRRTEEVRKLLRAGAPVDGVSSDGRTALHFAVMVNELPMVEVLLAAGARPDLADAFGDVPLHFAAQHPVRLPVLALLLERAPQVVNHSGGAGRTPLAVAADAKFTEGVRLLLEHGADPTIKDAAGMSAIDRAPNPKIKALLTRADGGTKTAPAKKSAPTSRKKKGSVEKRGVMKGGQRGGPLSSLDAWERASVADRSAAVRALLPAGFSVVGHCGAHRLAEIEQDASGARFVLVPGGRYLAGPGDRDREAMAALDVDEGIVDAMDGIEQREVELAPVLFGRHPKLASPHGRPLTCTKKRAAAIAAELTRDGLRLPTEDEWEWVARTCGRTVFVGAATAEEAEERCAELAEDLDYDPKLAGSALGVWGLMLGEWIGDEDCRPLAGISGAAQNHPFQDVDALAGCLACVGARPAKGEKLAVRPVKPLR
jgi:hypothetical protein